MIVRDTLRAQKLPSDRDDIFRKKSAPDLTPERFIV